MIPIKKLKIKLFITFFLVIFIASCSKHGIFSISGPNETVASTVAGILGSSGTLNGNRTNSSFNTPIGLVFDSERNLYIADSGNNLIRKVTLSGVVTTFAGSGNTGFLDGSSNTAEFNNPKGLTIDNSNNIYIADTDNHRIRKITTNGTVTTFVGSGLGSANGAGTSAQFNSPQDLVIDQSNNIYVADTGNNLIRKVTPSGVVTTFSSGFNRPTGIAIDKSGNLYVSDTGNHLIRKITSNGSVTNFAGSISGSANGTGTNAQFNQPREIAIDNANNLYVADSQNQTIRLITPDQKVSTFVGSDNFYGTSVRFNLPQGLAINNNYLYVSDTGNHVIKKLVITPSYTLQKRRGKQKTITVSPTQSLSDALKDQDGKKKKKRGQRHHRK